MSLIEIARLSDDQRDRLGEYGQRWSELRSSTAPCDRGGGRGWRRQGLRRGGPAPAARDRLGRWAARDCHRLGALPRRRRRQRALAGDRPGLPQGRGRSRPLRRPGGAGGAGRRASPDARAILLQQHRGGRASRLRARAAAAALPAGEPVRHAAPRAHELCLERVRICLRAAAGCARILPRCVRSQTPDGRAGGTVADRQAGLVDAAAPGRVLAGGAARASCARTRAGGCTAPTAPR